MGFLKALKYRECGREHPPSPYAGCEAHYALLDARGIEAFERAVKGVAHVA